MVDSFHLHKDYSGTLKVMAKPLVISKVNIGDIWIKRDI